MNLRLELYDSAEVARVVAELAEYKAKLAEVIEASEALLYNEEHAASGGMRSYQKGSPTDLLWGDLRKACETSAGLAKHVALRKAA